MQSLLAAYVQGAWIYLLGVSVLLQLAVLIHKVRVHRRMGIYLTAAMGSLALFVPTVIYLFSSTEIQVRLNSMLIVLVGCAGFFISVLLTVAYFASYQPRKGTPASSLEASSDTPAVSNEIPPRQFTPDPQTVDAPSQAVVKPAPSPAAPPKPLLNAWLRDEQQLGRAYQLSAGRTLIGRHSDCEVHLNDPAVSRFHASLQHKDGAFLLVDENSHTGTFVNGQRIDGQPYRLQIGDRIVMGDTTLGFFQE